MTPLRNHIFWILLAFILSVTNSFSQEKKPFNEKSLRLLEKLQLNINNHIDKKSALDSLQKKGYIFSEINLKNDSLHIKKGDLIEKIKLSYKSPDQKKQSSEISFKNLKSTLKQINQNYSDQGFPFNEINIDKITQLDTHLIKMELVITKNQKRRIDDLIIKGYTPLSSKQIKRSLNIGKKNLSKQKINEELEYLQNKLSFKLIKNPSVLYKKDKSVLYLYTEKASRNMFDGVLGFSNENDKFKLSGDLELELNNNLNAGESFQLNYKNTDSDQETIRAELTYPFIFNSRFDLETNFQIFRQDSSYTNTSFKAGLNFNINKTYYIKGSYQTRKSNAINEETNKDFKYNAFSATFGARWENLGQIELSTEFGQRKTETTDNQTLLEIKYFNKVNFNKTYHLLIQNENALLSSKNYLNNETFRIGGINSIRGFLENSIISTKYSSLRLDHNFELTETLTIIGITDYLLSFNDLNKIRTNYYSFGFGLSLQQNNTNIRIIMANGFTDNSDIDFNNTKIHIRLATFF
ncbi:hypothetical protein CAP47_09625 [Psychroflexus sp. S27]|nr:hypothetical protein CAP47_09625 [Psychroflexus sp. S27]